MKELSIEERAQRYDEALERAKKWYNAPNVDKIPTYGNRIIEEIFPELKEPNGEKVRKEIMQLIQGMHDADPRKERWLAWLEKQTPAVDTKVIIPKFRVGDIVKSKSQPMLSPSKITSIGKDCYYCDDGCIGFAWEDDCEIVEQKPVISDDALREGIAHFGITQYQIDNWLKKYVDVEKQGEQKPQRMISAEAKEAMYGKPTAWSEEDENEVAILEAYIRSGEWSESHIDRALGIVDELVNKVKSLKPQKHWKPNDTELEVLRLVAEKDGTCLMGLYEQLKKLREE